MAPSDRRRGVGARRKQDQVHDAAQRDEAARLSDLTASSRDQAAEARDQVAAQAASATGTLGDPSSNDATGQGPMTDADIRDLAAADRALAASDRARAASDRRQAASDRRLAAADRRQAVDDLQKAQLDSLTGVYLRDVGRVNLQDAIDRSRSSAEPFVLAFIDVDGLKKRNDSEGHAAGDALLQAVGNVLKSKLRHYDAVARVGGDEFLCGLTNIELDTSQARFDEIRAAVEIGPPPGSITVGLARLSSTDTLEDLTARADLDMYAHKPNKPTAPPAHDPL
jgi:diguanylate cyclase (GGDEF)-like protein